MAINDPDKPNIDTNNCHLSDMEIDNCEESKDSDNCEVSNTGADFISSLPLDVIILIALHLASKDLANLARTSRRCHFLVAGLLYETIDFNSPPSEQSYRLLQSLLNTNTPYRFENLHHVRVTGDTRSELSIVPTDTDMYHMADKLIHHSVDQGSSRRWTLPKPTPTTEFMRAITATWNTGSTLALIAVLLVRNLRSLEWRVKRNSGSNLTHLQLMLLAMKTWISLKLLVFPKLSTLKLAIEDPTDTDIPLTAGLKRLVVSGRANDPIVNIRFMTEDNHAQYELQEFVVSKVDVVPSMLDLLNAGRLHALRTLCMHTNTVQFTSNHYFGLVKLLAQQCPNLFKMVLDCEDVDFHNPGGPTPLEHLPMLQELTTVKYLKVYSRFLLPNLSHMDYSDKGSALPPNVETLVLTGLDLALFDAEKRYSDIKDPFKMAQLCAPLLLLKCLGLHLDHDDEDRAAGDHDV